MSNLTYSQKKFIRKEKARIRAEFFDFKKQQEMIDQLYQRFLSKKRGQKIKTDKNNEQDKKNNKKDYRNLIKKHKMAKAKI